MLAFTASIVAYQGAAPAPRPVVVAAVQRTVQPTALELDGLKELASKQNPVLGYYDPLNLASSNFWGDTDAATIGWLRHAEIKHGRVAMFGFVGYIVHEYGLRWGMPLSPNVPMSTFDGMSAPAIWEALPIASKWQIVFFVGLLEIHSEGERDSGAILAQVCAIPRNHSDATPSSSGGFDKDAATLTKNGEKHYMRGGKPGYFPPFGGPVPDLVFGRAGITRASAETNAKRLNVEVNNGRLAMIGLFGFLAEANCPGAVPGLTGLIKPYGGPKIMSPDWLYNTWECMVPSTDACWFADGPAAAAPAVVKAAATAAAPAVEAASGAFEAAASAL